MVTVDEHEAILLDIEKSIEKSKRLLENKDSSVLMATPKPFTRGVKINIKNLITFSLDPDQFISKCEELVGIELEKKKSYRTNIGVSRSNEKLNQIMKSLTKLITKIEDLDSRTFELINQNALNAKNFINDSKSLSGVDTIIDEVYYLFAASKLSISPTTGEHVTLPLYFISSIHSLWNKHNGPEVEPNSREKFFNLVVILLSEAGLPNKNPSFLINKALF